MIEVVFLLILYFFVFVPHTQAYLDPGTGSYITQLMIGFLVGGMYMIKLYWGHLKSYFKKDKNKESESENKE